MALPGNPTCVTCVFFNRFRPPTDHGGQCRFHAPLMQITKEHGVKTIWPLVYVDSWCGQHSVADNGQ
jgi:hypothetical protein